MSNCRAVRVRSHSMTTVVMIGAGDASGGRIRDLRHFQAIDVAARDPYERLPDATAP